jgi:hypothetical protein
MSGRELISVVIKPEDKTVAGNNVVMGYWRAPCTCTLVGAYAVDTTNLAKAASAYLTITVTNSGQAGAGTTAMATGNASGSSGNWIAAGVHTALTVSTTATYDECVAGDIIKVVKTEASTGQDFTEGSVQLDFVTGR